MPQVDNIDTNQRRKSARLGGKNDTGLPEQVPNVQIVDDTISDDALPHPISNADGEENAPSLCVRVAGKVHGREEEDSEPASSSDDSSTDDEEDDEEDVHSRLESE